MRVITTHTTEPRQTQSGRGYRYALILLSLFCFAPAYRQLAAQPPGAEREAKIKAAYLYQFINYVQWPDEAFAEPTSPLVIGTLGTDPVNRYLDAIAQKRTAGSRSLVYTPVDSAQEAANCHILFISDTVEEARVDRLITNLPDASILLVGEHASFLSNGGVIGFLIVGNNVRLQLSMQAATDRGLKISSQLAKIADVVY